MSLCRGCACIETPFNRTLLVDTTCIFVETISEGLLSISVQASDRSDNKNVKFLAKHNKVSIQSACKISQRPYPAD